MLADDVKTNFPSGIMMPDTIQALCEYLDVHGYPMSGCFEISTIGNDDMQAWFPNDAAMQDRFAVFGRGSTGSVYAIWLQDDANATSSPVVVLGSEGDLLVLATDSAEFCRLLGCGYNEVEWEDLTKPSPEWDDTKRLRDWLGGRFNMDFPKTGELIVAAAHKRYPDFPAFIQTWWEANSQSNDK